MVKKDDVKPESERDEVTHKDEPAKDAPAVEEAQNDAEVVKRAPWPLITVGIFGTVLLLAAVAMAWLQLFGMHHNAMQTIPEYGYMQHSGQQYGGREYSRDGRRGSGFARPAVSGVATVVNGDTIAVSGSGKQVMVKKSTSTTIAGDESDVAVNDTIVVYGTKNDDGSIEATRIMVRNSAMLDGALFDEQDNMQIPSA